MGKKKGLFDGVESLLDKLEEAFEVEQTERVITESEETTTTSKGMLRQSMRGEGYEISVRRPKGQNPRIKIVSDVPISVTINDEVVYRTDKA